MGPTPLARPTVAAGAGIGPPSPTRLPRTRSMAPGQWGSGPGVTAVPSSPSSTLGQPVPLSPASLPSTPGGPQGRSLSLPLAAGIPAARPPRVQPAPPIPCALLRGWLQTVWASQRGPGNRATGSQSHACQLLSGRDQGGREGGTSPLANQGGFLGHRVSGHRVGPVGGAVGERPERRPRGARGPQSTEAALRGRGLWPTGHGASQGRPGNCSWAEACLAISDLGAGLSPRTPYQAGREEWPGSGGLESEVGTSWKQLDRGVRSSRETDLGA